MNKPSNNPHAFPLPDCNTHTYMWEDGEHDTCYRCGADRPAVEQTDANTRTLTLPGSNSPKDGGNEFRIEASRGYGQMKLDIEADMENDGVTLYMASGRARELAAWLVERADDFDTTDTK